MVSHNCRDPSSTQVFEGLIAGAVPVYRGTRGVHRFLPSNDSYIDANNISAKDLAAMLQNIGRSEELYNKYFAFKKKPLPESFKRIASMSYSHPNVLCRLCDYALSAKRTRGIDGT